MNVNAAAPGPRLGEQFSRVADDPRIAAAMSPTAKMSLAEVQAVLREVVEERLAMWRLDVAVDQREGETPLYSPPLAESQRPTTANLGWVAVPLGDALDHSPFLRDQLRTISSDVDKVLKFVTLIAAGQYEQQRVAGAPYLLGRMTQDGELSFEVIEGRHRLLAHIIAGERTMSTTVKYESWGLVGDQRAVGFLEQHQLDVSGQVNVPNDAALGF